MDSFAAGEPQWITRLGNLRNAVRQELIARQLGDQLSDGVSVLDVGCGQGTQAIRLARRGCQVVGVDPSVGLLGRLAADAGQAGVTVQTHLGQVEDLSSIIGDQCFDVVCAHGLLMYLADPGAALAALAGRVGSGGLLSITFRNGTALAFRPALRGQWQQALAAFDAQTYRNELGLQAQAHRLDQVSGWLAELGLQVESWFGVRVFTDPADADLPVDPAVFHVLIQAEEQAGRRDPYRQLASQLHVLARRPVTG